MSAFEKEAAILLVPVVERGQESLDLKVEYFRFFSIEPDLDGLAACEMNCELLDDPLGLSHGMTPLVCCCANEPREAGTGLAAPGGSELWQGGCRQVTDMRERPGELYGF